MSNIKEFKEKFYALITDAQQENIISLNKRKYEDILLDALISLYTGQQRFYHNVDHINDMIEALEFFKDTLNLTKEDEILLKFSILFHDALYTPENKSNEETSASLARVFLTFLKMKSKHINKVSKIINSGKYIFNPKKISGKLSKILNDLDLRQLGTDNYLKNKSLIRKEFSHLTEHDWIEKRLEFLKKLKERKYLFNTKRFYFIYEEHARKNINLEVNKLKYKLRQ